MWTLLWKCFTEKIISFYLFNAIHKKDLLKMLIILKMYFVWILIKNNSLLQNKGLPSPAGGDNQINTMSVNPQMFTQICFSEEEIVG